MGFKPVGNNGLAVLTFDKLWSMGNPALEKMSKKQLSSLFEGLCAKEESLRRLRAGFEPLCEARMAKMRVDRIIRWKEKGIVPEPEEPARQ